MHNVKHGRRTSSSSLMRPFLRRRALRFSSSSCMSLVTAASVSCTSSSGMGVAVECGGVDPAPLEGDAGPVEGAAPEGAGVEPLLEGALGAAASGELPGVSCCDGDGATGADSCALAEPLRTSSAVPVQPDAQEYWHGTKADAAAHSAAKGMAQTGTHPIMRAQSLAGWPHVPMHLAMPMLPRSASHLLPGVQDHLLVHWQQRLLASGWSNAHGGIPQRCLARRPA